MRHDVSAVLNAAELDTLIADKGSCMVYAVIRSVTSAVRAAIANNHLNKLDDTELQSLPVSLHALALDLIAVRLLKRFDLVVSEARLTAAKNAEALLERISSGDYKVPGPDGQMDEGSPKPFYKGRTKVWGNTKRGGIM